MGGSALDPRAEGIFRRIAVQLDQCLDLVLGSGDGEFYSRVRPNYESMIWLYKERKPFFVPTVGEAVSEGYRYQLLDVEPSRSYQHVPYGLEISSEGGVEVSSKEERRYLVSQNSDSAISSISIHVGSKVVQVRPSLFFVEGRKKAYPKFKIVLDPFDEDKLHLEDHDYDIHRVIGQNLRILESGIPSAVDRLLRTDQEDRDRQLKDNLVGFLSSLEESGFRIFESKSGSNYYLYPLYPFELYLEELPDLSLVLVGFSLYTYPSPYVV